MEELINRHYKEAPEKQFYYVIPLDPGDHIVPFMYTVSEGITLVSGNGQNGQQKIGSIRQSLGPSATSCYYRAGLQENSIGVHY